MKKLQLEQGSSEWHEFRKNHIGSSDAPIIMNVSPWKTAYQLWKEKLGLEENRFVSEAMKRGIDLEEKARQLVSEYLDEDFQPTVCVSDSIEWMAASLDGLSPNGKYAVEIKCPNRDDHSLALNDIVPEKYIPQLQHQLAVCDLDFIYYFSFDGNDGKTIKVHRDEKYIKNLIEQEKLFWKGLETLTAPSLSNRDFLEIEDTEWNKYSSEWKSISTQLKYLENKEKEIRECLIKLSNNQSCKGNGVRLSKVIRKGTIDYESIPELKAVDLEKYRKKPIESWRISIN